MKKQVIMLSVMALSLCIFNGCGSDAKDATNDVISVDRSETEKTKGEVAVADGGDGLDSPEVEVAGADDEGFGAEGAYGMDYAEVAEGMIEGGDKPLTEGDTEFSPANHQKDAFVLTAGEWNDNNNWGFFHNLVSTGLIDFPSYGLSPVQRVKVTISNGENTIANQKVYLKDAEGAILWSAQSDKNGVAYLFYPNDYNQDSVYVSTDESDVQELTIKKSDDAQSGTIMASDLETTISVSTEETQKNKTEVMFILDTTGSMGDELAFLQSDFTSIVKEVEVENISYSVNFYRDEGDDYVTKCNPFIEDTDSVQSILSSEYALGGGDTPEAVAEILNDTMVNANWSEDSNKIAFLIFDAPPHRGENNENLIVNAVKVASEKGIHVVPVVASNSDRETELFGRALSIMTNANYVFLTDDSGVGDSHLEPIIGSYDVELLHDIIVRNITEIAQS